jgi:hypothetical protein
VDNAAEIMNRHDAMKVEELVGSEPDTGSSMVGESGESAAPVHDSFTQTGRTRQSGGGARMFVW